MGKPCFQKEVIGKRSKREEKNQTFCTLLAGVSLAEALHL